MSTVSPAEFEAIDDHLSKALDGDAGGSYAPSAPLIIGGSGIELTSASTFTDWTGNFVDTAALQATSSTLHDAAFDGTVDFSTGVTSFHNGFEALNDTTWHNKQAIFRDGGGTIVAEIGSSGLTIGVASDFTAQMVVSAELALLGAGRIRERVTQAADANTTYDITTTDVLVINGSGAITSSHIYTIDSTGASIGSRIEIRNYDLSHTHVIKNIAGSIIATVPIGVQAAYGGKVGAIFAAPSILRLEWCDAVGIAVRWEVVELAIAA